jgi:hypothetical protein
MCVIKCPVHVILLELSTAKNICWRKNHWLERYAYNMVEYSFPARSIIPWLRTLQICMQEISASKLGGVTSYFIF